MKSYSYHLAHLVHHDGENIRDITSCAIIFLYTLHGIAEARALLPMAP